jgi:hypothetical protein
MCTEFFLAFIYFITIFIVNYFLSKLVKNYFENIFSLLKLKNIFQTFQKSTNNLIFLLSSFEKKEKPNMSLLRSFPSSSTTQDILVIGNIYKYLAQKRQQEGWTDINKYYVELLGNQYLSSKKQLK